MTRVRVQAVHPDGTLVSAPATIRGGDSTLEIVVDFERLCVAAECVFLMLGARAQVCEWTIRPDHYEAT